MQYWLAGAVYDNNDMAEKFIAERYWENGYDDKFVELVNSIDVGDKIAIKSTYTRKHNLPFNGHENTVSCMKIKAVGIVTKNYNNGKRIDVAWASPYQPSEWYFFTYWKTISKIPQSGNWMHQALIDFVFNSIPQNLSRFRNAPYWREMYGDMLDQQEVYNDRDLIEVVGNTPPITKRLNITDEKKDKRGLIYAQGSEIMPRDVSVSKNALKYAEYRCEYESEHLTFKRKTPPHIMYTEPHHLIPLSNHHDFDCSLDVEANICSLCSTCHNCVHYGMEQDRNLILHKLYNKRKSRLKKAGLEITWDDLKKYY